MITIHQVSDLNIIICMKYPVAEPTNTTFLNKSEVWPKNIKKYLFSTPVYFQECSNSLIIMQSCKEIDRMLLSLYDIVTQKHSNFYWFVSMSVSMLQMVCFFHHCLFQSSHDRGKWIYLRFEGTSLTQLCHWSISSTALLLCRSLYFLFCLYIEGHIQL